MAISRLQAACIEAPSLEAAVDAVVKLHRQLWLECADKTEQPGDIYGEALEAAGFRPGDRYDMASFSWSGATRIAQRERNACKSCGRTGGDPVAMAGQGAGACTLCRGSSVIADGRSDANIERIYGKGAFADRYGRIFVPAPGRSCTLDIVTGKVTNE